MGAIIKLRDGFTNLLAGLGVPGRDKFASQQYTFVPMSLSECEMAYRGDWIARKCIDIPASDMTREWRAWQAEQDQITKLEMCERTLSVQSKLQQALIKARLYGGSVIVIGVESGNPEEELDPESVGEGDLKFLHVVPWHYLSMGEIVWDVTSPYWGQPSSYQCRRRHRDLTCQCQQRALAMRRARKSSCIRRGSCASSGCRYLTS
jgi:phage-related protein (TIGR01555 family)